MSTCLDRFCPTRQSFPALVALLIVSGLCAVNDIAAQTTIQTAVRPALNADEQIIHVLNRLTYGLRPGDIDRVRTMGIQAYIEQQLQPALIPDPVVERKLAGLSSLHLDLYQGERVYRLIDARQLRTQELADRKARMAGEGAAGPTLERTKVDSVTVAQLRRGMLNPQVSGKVVANRRPPELEIAQARMIRAVHSERQLYELMVDFWMNHFSVFFDTDEFELLDWEERVIRPHAMGSFEDLLVATATHPAMLKYLDNWLSSAPADVVLARLEAGHPVAPDAGPNRRLALRQRRDFFKDSQGLNENYGRELMELHTLGVEGGYTQEDVEQVAKAFTGWTVSGPRDRGGFVFDPLLHIDGDKVVLGQRIPSGGMDEGMRILRMLARHSSTARFISTKLVRRFVADDPPVKIVEAASRAYLESDGDIPTVLRAIFTAPSFFDAQYYRAKIKKPIEFVASGLRAVDAAVDIETKGSSWFRPMLLMGEPLYRHEAPDGYPDIGSAWMSTNTLFERLDFVIRIATDRVPQVTTDLMMGRRMLDQLGFAEATPEQVALVESMMAKSNNGLAVAGAPMMMQGMGGLGAAGARQGEIDADLVIAVALALGSPGFQKR